jgi:hypothetical protein
VQDEAVRFEAGLELAELVDRRLAREEQGERPLERQLNRVGEEWLAKRSVVEPAPFDDDVAVLRAGANGRPAGQVDGRLLMSNARASRSAPAGARRRPRSP